MRVAKKICGLTLLLILWFISVLCGQGNLPVMAATDNGYSSVLGDLKKDSSFSESFYPAAGDDYSLQIIQLAESANKELFVYVYQPCGKTKDLRASSINISITVNDEISFINYKLDYLNSSGVFYKYKVKDFTVLDEPTRYYAISSIYRPFDGDIDKNAEHGNEITEVNYNISKQYCFSEINGKPYCSVVDIETIVITDKFVGFVRYKNGFQLFPSSCDSHFVAFNTDKPIDKLLEADVYYTTQNYSTSYIIIAGESETFGEKSDNYAYLKYTDRVEHTGSGWFAGTYKWDRIETVEQFIAENDLTQNVYSGALFDVNVANKITDEGKAALQGKKWLLRFAETEYQFGGSTGTTWSNSVIVGDVTILRLKFVTDGITYNLGVIDNKQSGSDTPINDEELQVKPNTTAIIILIIILLVILFIVLINFVPAVLSLVTKLLVWIGKALLWLISAPFKLIGLIIGKLKR